MSNLAHEEYAEVCGGAPSAGALEEIAPVTVDVGSITVRRLLPRRERRLVGPWCFIDVFGPVDQAGVKVMDVPPHPHIGLQTVTWLFEGDALHKDSLGSEALATPGTLNLMTAGRGIAHSEETPPGAKGPLHGVQLWVALPDAQRQVEPAFDHYRRPAAGRRPRRTRDGVPGADVGGGGRRAHVLAACWGRRSSPTARRAW